MSTAGLENVVPFHSYGSSSPSCISISDSMKLSLINRRILREPRCRGIRSRSAEGLLAFGRVGCGGSVEGNSSIVCGADARADAAANTARALHLCLGRTGGPREQPYSSGASLTWFLPEVKKNDLKTRTCARKRSLENTQNTTRTWWPRASSDVLGPLIFHLAGLARRQAHPACKSICAQSPLHLFHRRTHPDSASGRIVTHEAGLSPSAAFVR